MRRYCCLLACALLLAAACRRQETPLRPPPPRQPAITISPALPSDVPGGAENADLATASRFAWQQFIAMNWPAAPNVRDMPAESMKFGQPAPNVVWETFRSGIEVYPGGASASVKPHGMDSGKPDFGYDEPPQYQYVTNPIPPCDKPSASPAYVNLDEVTQVGFNHLFAGANSNALVRYLSKANRGNYTYVVKNSYWYSQDGSPYAKARDNFLAAVTGSKFPPASPYVSFPSGTMEIKAAFRPLTPAEKNSGRYYQSLVRYYDVNAKNAVCYKEDVWGLLGLHIVQKTPTAQAFTWATFEQADTVVNATGVPVEDDDGNLLHPGPPYTPAMKYTDGQYKVGVLPLVAKSGDFCADAGMRLFFQEIYTANPPVGTNVPHGGNICVDQRQRAIPPTVIATNKLAHAAIAEYESKYSMKSPWRHYKLVNVQVYPFDKTEIDPNDDSKHGAPVFYTANMAIETDYTLQNHSGGPENHTGSAPSDLACNYTAGATCDKPYQNVYALRPDGSLIRTYNMGGCTGCHGLTQVRAGTDYSYLMSIPNTDPQVPATPPDVTSKRYFGLFNR